VIVIDIQAVAKGDLRCIIIDINADAQQHMAITVGNMHGKLNNENPDPYNLCCWLNLSFMYDRL